MLFSSYDFIFLFLPITFILTLLSQNTRFFNLPSYILLAASLVFFGWSDIGLITLIGVSIGINYFFSLLSARYKSKAVLAAAIMVNAGLLGYFKYTNFFLANINTALGLHIGLLDIALPLGISFFTFQQIGYQVDVYKGIVKPPSLPHYALFVTFFPQLIAGPIVHCTNFFPQISKIKITYAGLGAGVSLFVLGLSKKILIADRLAPLVNYYYANIGNDDFSAGIIDTWLAVLAYSFQLYFDFSGYADMALGLGLCFSVIFPINFFSPYKAVSLTEFWRRWHITLSDFLRAYIYIPLGGNRTTPFRSSLNVVLTMLLGGIWHGAGWTFVLWGFFSGLIMTLEKTISGLIKIPYTLKIAATFIMVTLLWVLFRADSLDDAMQIYTRLLGMHTDWVGTAIHEPQLYGSVEKKFIALLPEQVASLLVWGGILGLSFVLVFIAPNTAQIFSDQIALKGHYPKLAAQKSLFEKLHWKPNIFWLVFICALLLLDTFFMKRQAAFLYFQF